MASKRSPARTVGCPPSGAARIDAWYASRQWQPFDFQREAWADYERGESGLIHAPTGTGKTHAAWLGVVREYLDEPTTKETPALRVLWITPLRALAADTTASLQMPIEDLKIPWTVQARTGDTKASLKAKQKAKLPTALVTTPESLCLLLTLPDGADRFADLRLVVVDEWHELISSKRGVLVELALARLRALRPSLRTWGLSATLGNTAEAARVLCGQSQPRLIRGSQPKTIAIDALLPAQASRFPWAGHLGLNQVHQVIAAIEEGSTALVFTNTRSQTELWYQAILNAKKEWAGQMALHHGSLDRKVRDWVEDGLKTGKLRCVVCTSSLDLGVDFSPVDRVIQIGSPKGVARLLQRAGRSGHQPGKSSRVSCVPTHAMEIVEVAAARDAALAGKIEARPALQLPLDVLVQHLVTIALGSGFQPEAMRREIQSTHAFEAISDAEWQWCLDFITRGGESLRAYPEYRKVVVDADGWYRVTDAAVARRHRMSIGTILSDGMIRVQFVRGPVVGTVEESFIGKLKPGDQFLFGGKLLQLVRVRDMTAQVVKAKGKKGAVPRWMGGRMPLSSELAAAVRAKLDEARRGEFSSPEMLAVREILELQMRWSKLPAANEMLLEAVQSREGHHLFVFPFEGRQVHEGLSALVAYRLSKRQPITFTIAINDYGFELLSPSPIPIADAIDAGLFSVANLAEDIAASLNNVEMAKRAFREIARVAGLIFQGFPGANKSNKQLQASSGLFFDVFQNYDPGNLLLRQAYREVLERQLEEKRLHGVLERLSNSKIVLTSPHKPTPLAFPILVDRMRESLSSEKLADRVRRMQAEMEAASDSP